MKGQLYSLCRHRVQRWVDFGSWSWSTHSVVRKTHGVPNHHGTALLLGCGKSTRAKRKGKSGKDSQRRCSVTMASAKIQTKINTFPLKRIMMTYFCVYTVLGNQHIQYPHITYLQYTRIPDYMLPDCLITCYLASCWKVIFTIYSLNK